MMRICRTRLSVTLAIASTFAVTHALSAATNMYHWESVPIRSYAEFTQGIPAGEGEQHPKSIARCPANPAYVYLGIDVAGTWRSTNGGRAWIKNRDAGLYVQNIQSLSVDPLNPLIAFLTAAPPSGRTNVLGQFSGIYRTDDGGDTWTFVHKCYVPYAHERAQRIDRKQVAPRAPVSTDTYARSWYAAIDTQGIFESHDSGLTWTPYFTNLKHYLYYTVAVHADPATGEDVLYIGTADGLERYTRENGEVVRRELHVPKFYDPPNWAGLGGISSVCLVEGSGAARAPETPAPAGSGAHTDHPRPRPDGFPDSIAWPRESCVARATRPRAAASLAGIWVARRYDKAYYTTCPVPSSDVQWIELDLYTEDGEPWLVSGTDSNNWPGAGYARNVFVNPSDPRHAYVVGGSQFLRLDASTGTQRWVRVPRESFTNHPTIAKYAKSMRGDHAGIGFNPNDPSDLVGYAVSTTFRSDNAGKSWTQSNAGYSGYAWQYGPFSARFSRDDSNTVVLYCNDVGPVISTSNWDWFWSAESSGAPDDLWKGTATGDIDPDEFANMVCLMGYYSGYKPVISRNAGRTWEFPGGTNISLYFRHARGVHYVSTSTVFAALVVSTNNGETFSAIDFGATYPGRVPPTDENCLVVGASTNQTWPILYALKRSGYQHILRGERVGDTYLWSKVYDKWYYQFKSFDGSPIFAADPHVPTRIYGAVDSATKLLRFDTDLGLYTNPPDSALELHDFEPYLPDQAVEEPYNQALVITPDPTEKDVIFVGASSQGMPYVFKCRFITNTIAVTDITGNAPQLGIRGMQVDPHRGDLYLGSCAGTYRLRDP